MYKQFFITGTDTDIGKTYISIGLLKKFNSLKFKTIGIKPIGSGGRLINDKIHNEDALRLQEHASIHLEYDVINPVSFLPPVSPNIGAKLSNTRLTAESIHRKLENILNNKDYEICIIEGTGGWHTPLNSTETMADLVYKLNIPIILIIGIRLGCLNHSILTYQAIKNKKLIIKGWIANCIHLETKEKDLNIQTLKQHIKAPCLGIINHNQRPEEALDITALL